MKDRHLTRRIASPPARLSASDRVGAVLEETRTLEDEARLLEEALPPLQARLDAAVRPLVDGVEQTRRALFVLVERRILSASGRERRFVREATELLRHLAADLEERFGVVVRSAILRDGPEDGEPGEDDGAWSPDAWERSSGPERPRSPSRPARGRGVVDPEVAARGIYRSLARELHPDKTTDDAERTRRTSLMQELTAAWRDRDLSSLLRLLHAHGSEDAREGALDERSLEAVLRGLEEERDRLRARVRALRHQWLPEGAVDWMPLVRDPKLFERALRRAKRIPREELEQMLRLKALFARASGLEEFLDEVPWEDWPSVV